MHLFSLIRYHSKIIGLYLGRFPVVAIYDFNIAKEVFSREDLTGRPDNFAYRFRSLGKRQGKNSIIEITCSFHGLSLISLWVTYV